MRFTIVLLGLLIGCEGAQGSDGARGQQGEPGAQGDPGMQGSAGPAGPGVGWADATGKVVPGAADQLVSDPGKVRYIDPATGYQWRLSVEFGGLDADGGVVSWTTDDCSGTSAYVTVQGGAGSLLPLPPRVVFGVDTASGTEYRVRKDNAVVAPGSAPTDYASFGLPGDCSASPFSGFGLDASQTTVVTVPTLTLTPPLHPVLAGQP
jgi:hypothetical protein